jgi:hypothetical protein
MVKQVIVINKGVDSKHTIIKLDLYDFRQMMLILINSFVYLYKAW